MAKRVVIVSEKQAFLSGLVAFVFLLGFLGAAVYVSFLVLAAGAALYALWKQPKLIAIGVALSLAAWALTRNMNLAAGIALFFVLWALCIGEQTRAE